jgi:ElaB/YqjD/DUF883 family membrane-anchored ribosome-binding protein
MQKKTERADRSYYEATPINAAGVDPLSSSPPDASGGQGADDVKAKAKEAGRKIEEKADETRESAAEGLGTAATKLREKSQEQDGMAAEAGSKIAEGMDQTASYLKEHDTGEMVDDLERYIRQHPMQAVAGAVAAGFVIGRILR